MSDYSSSPYYATAIAAADQYNVPENVFVQLIGSESSFSPTPGPGGSPYNAGNPSFGGGIAQFIPSTASSLGVDRLDPTSSLYGAASYLSSLYQRAGSWAGAVALYKGTGQQYGGSVGAGSPLAQALANPSSVSGATPVADTSAGAAAPASSGFLGSAASGIVGDAVSAIGAVASRGALIAVGIVFLLGAMLIFARQQ